jgi:hypothetical protein
VFGPCQQHVETTSASLAPCLARSMWQKPAWIKSARKQQQTGRKQSQVLSIVIWNLEKHLAQLPNPDARARFHPPPSILCFASASCVRARKAHGHFIGSRCRSSLVLIPSPPLPPWCRPPPTHDSVPHHATPPHCHPALWAAQTLCLRPRRHGCWPSHVPSPPPRPQGPPSTRRIPPASAPLRPHSALSSLPPPPLVRDLKYGAQGVGRTHGSERFGVRISFVTRSPEAGPLFSSSKTTLPTLRVCLPAPQLRGPPHPPRVTPRPASPPPPHLQGRRISLGRAKGWRGLASEGQGRRDGLGRAH